MAYWDFVIFTFR